MKDTKIMAGSLAETDIVSRDPEIMNGTLVFAGTRVPVRTLIDHLTAGETIDDFRRDFPSVRREQAIAYLEMAFRAGDARAAR